MRRCVLLLLALALLPHGARGQAATAAADSRYDPRLFSALRWRNIGPNRAGRSLATAGSPSRPFEYYAGAVGGGLWKTTDGGTTWRPVTDGQIKSSSVGAVAVAESNPDVVYIGMGEVQVQRDMMQGDGMYGSRDAGRTWTHLGLDNTQVIARVRVHSRDPDVVFVAAFGSFYGPGDARGVFRSRDGGKTWQRVLFRDDRTGAVDLAMARQNPDVIFAALWQASVSPSGAVSSGGAGSGLFKSTNGGDTWTEITRNPGLPTGVIGKIGVAVSGADLNRVYALVEAEGGGGGGGLFRSDDGGATWTRVNENGELRQRPSYFNRVYADPNDKDVVYIQNLPLVRSSDGGRTFVTIQTPPHVDHHDLWIAPNDSRRMIDGNDGGPTVSINYGETWTAQTLPTAQLYHVATTRDLPYDVCGAQQDASAVCVPSSSAEMRSTSPYVGSGNFGGFMYAPGGGEFGTIAAHPRNPDLFFATGPSVITRYDRRTGLTQARDVHVSPLPDRGPDRERFATIAPIVFARRDSDVVYTASQRVWRSSDGGMQWTRLSGDLTRGGSVFTIAPSYHDARTMWVGTDDGVVQVTRDGGATWTVVTPKELPEASRISHIEASAHQPGTAYVAAKRFEWDDRAPYVFRTDDFGRTWRRIVAGISANDFVHVVREDPARAGLLFAGSEHGVYVSFDGGDHWQSLSINLPDTEVPDLVVEANDLVIATHGRSFYVLDDIGPLRQLTPQVAAASVHLFQPRDAIRRINTVVIDYALAAAAPAVSIDVLDAKGTVIRTLRSEGRAGLNRVTWDLRYAGSSVFPGMIMWVGSPNGPIAAPGDYQVRLTASGETRTQPLRLRRDPRATDVTDADIQEQFALALKLRDRISDANDGVTRIRSVRPQIQAKAGQSSDARIAALGDSLSRRLSEVEGALYQVRLRSQLDAIQYPMMLNNRLANLKLSIETGDGRPTAQAFAAFNRLSSELDAQLAKLDALLKTETPRFNRLLVERSIEPIRVVP